MLKTTMPKYYKIILNIARSLAVPCFNFLIAIIGVKYLGKNNWGDFIQILLWIYFVAFIANFGNKDFLLREFSKSPASLDRSFFLNLISRSLLLSLSFILLLFFPLKTALLSILLVLLLFIYQSLESLVIYNQKFFTQLVSEIVGFIVIISVIFFTNEVNSDILILSYCLAFILKIAIVLPILKLNFNTIEFKFSLSQFQLTLPFFLIGLSGWLSSKIDLYLVNIILPKSELAEYQLLITAFLLLRSLAALIIYPFTKHIYRLQRKTIKKINRILFIASAPLVIVGTFIIWFIFEKIIFLNVSVNLYIFGALSSLPYYFFIIDIFLFYKHKKENKVMYLNFSAAIFNFILAILLIPKYGITGALLGVMFTQFVVLFIYKIKLLK
jgi:O-antigen/teichoic acid export membrane protein